MDDLDTIINDLVPHRTSVRRFLSGLLLGLVGGASAAALLLPRSGPELRMLLRERGMVLRGLIRQALTSEHPM